MQTAIGLLRHCGASRVVHLLRLLPPDVVREFTATADEFLLAALSTTLDLPL